MLSIEDGEQARPIVTEPHLQYILHLADTCKSYTRFVDALLISRPSHAAFFHDLKSFRNQPVVISLLRSCDPFHASTDKVQIKERYREVTRLFLYSRWSHPWCRKAGDNWDATIRSRGRWGAGWKASGAGMARKEQEDENRLHQTLLPIWAIMRAKMFPGDQVVYDWWKKRQLEEKQQQEDSYLSLSCDVRVCWKKPDVDIAVSDIRPLSEVDRDNSSPVSLSAASTSSNPFREGGGYCLRPVETVPNMREEFWNSSEGQQLEQELRRKSQESAHAATAAGVFRAIATGILLTSIPKKKLRRFANARSGDNLL